MCIEKVDIKELLSEARAIHFAYLNGAITRNQAKLRSKPILRRINATVKAIAKKYKVKPKYIKFYDLGNNI